MALRRTGTAQPPCYDRILGDVVERLTRGRVICDAAPEKQYFSSQARKNFTYGCIYAVLNTTKHNYKTSTMWVACRLPT